MHKSIIRTEKLPEVLAQEEIEKQRMNDVLLLLKSLSNREEVTIKLIIDSLYDIGSINFINKKIRSRYLRKILKPIGRMSKPLFRFFAWRWFLKNFPSLVAKFLYKQVSFTASKKVQKAVIVAKQDIQLEASMKPKRELVKQQLNQEIIHLRSRVQWLTGILIGVITIFSSGFVWLGYELERSHLRTVEELKMQVKILEAGANK